MWFAMRRALSSDWTYFEKWVGPLSFGLGGVILIAQLVMNFRDVEAGDLLFAALWLPVALAVCCYGWRRKHVSVDGQFLYVTNYRKEIAIPLSEVGGVTYFGLGSIQTVTVHLRSPSEFGRRIKFTPRRHSLFGIDEPPAVGQLRSLARQQGRVTPNGAT